MTDYRHVCVRELEPGMVNPFMGTVRTVARVGDMLTVVEYTSGYTQRYGRTDTLVPILSKEGDS